MFSNTFYKECMWHEWNTSFVFLIKLLDWISLWSSSWGCGLSEMFIYDLLVGTWRMLFYWNVRDVWRAFLISNMCSYTILKDTPIIHFPRFCLKYKTLAFWFFLTTAYFYFFVKFYIHGLSKLGALNLLTDSSTKNISFS